MLKNLCKVVQKVNRSQQNFYSNTSKSLVKFRFIEEGSDNNIVEVDAPLGKKILDVALEHNVDIEGACGGVLACSTCHVIVDKQLYDRLPPKKVEEEDMLDLAWGLTETSRLCCQLLVTEDLEGAVFRVPNINNMK